MQNEFVKAIRSNQPAFGLELSDDAIGRLADFYELIQEHNPILHLVGPCSPEEFAIRHILESLTLLDYLPNGAKFADVGAGAGLPSIPCLLVRDDLRATLIESKEKKTKFLELAVEKLGIAVRAEIVNKQFQEADLSDCRYITCRALDKFSEKLPGLLKWAKNRRLLLFGGPFLEERLRGLGIQLKRQLIPMSEKRFLFILDRASTGKAK